MVTSCLFVDNVKIVCRVGRSVYTCMLNSHGGVESDLVWHVVNPEETGIQNVVG